MKPNDKPNEKSSLDELIQSDSDESDPEKANKLLKKENGMLKQENGILKQDLSEYQDAIEMYNAETKFLKPEVIARATQTDVQTEFIFKRSTSISDDGYESESKRVRLNPRSDKIFEEFQEMNSDILQTRPQAEIRAEPLEPNLENGMQILNDRPHEDNTSNADTVDDNAKQLKPADMDLLSKLFTYVTADSDATKPIPISNSDKEKCWLNVILQTFLFTRPMCGFLRNWREIFQGRIKKNAENYSLPLSTFRANNLEFTVKLMNCAHMLTRLAAEESEDSFDTSRFKKVLFSRVPRLKRDYQDASEGLNEILNIFKEELTKSQELLLIEGVDTKQVLTYDGFTVVIQHRITEYIDGNTKDVTKRNDNNQLVRLLVQNKEDTVTISDLLNAKFDSKEVRTLKDGPNGEKRRREEIEKIQKLPDCLIIELNRDLTGNKSARGNKGECIVEPRITIKHKWCANQSQLKKIPEYEYALKHIICYIDSHYYAVTTRGGGNFERLWWKTNDHIIDELCEESFLTGPHCNRAQILFYEKV